jgi:hypothetical protein
MKVRVTVTLDVDPTKWSWEYGLANVEAGDTPREQNDEVRADVKQWAEHALHEMLAQSGLGVEREVAA